MSTSPSPPPSTASVAETYSLTHLDQLLTTYLSLLDTYTTLRNALSQDLSAGFFSLAQAQRSAMLPPGRRYGEEMYDGRMKAERQVHAQGTRVEIHERSPAAKMARNSSSDLDDEGKPGSPEESVPESEHEHEHRKKEKSNPPTHDTTPTKSSTAKSTNPLRWFGVLTPPPLRASQSSFVSALNTIPSLITTSREMAALEDEIEEVRNALGLNDTRTKRSDAVAEEDQDIERQEDAKTATSPKRRGLASRGKVVEHRSRVLKLGN